MPLNGRLTYLLLFLLSAIVTDGFAQEDSHNTKEVILDEVVVDGDRLRGEVLEITDAGVRFRTVYGEGELFIPFEKIERLTRDGVIQSVDQATKSATPAEVGLVIVLTNLVDEAVSTNANERSEIALQSPESIDSQLEQMEELQVSWMERIQNRLGVQRFNQANDWLDEKLRLRLGLAYTSLGMFSTDAPYGDAGAGAGDFDFFGRWRAWGMDSGNTGTIGFNVRHRHRYTAIPPSQLNTSIGYPWNVTSGFDDSGFQVTQAYLDQFFLDRNVAFRIGQIFQDLHFDTYSYKSQKLFFLNSAFSDNPAVAFPDAGVGFATLIKPVEGWYVISGVGDSQERKLDSTFEALFSDKLFSGLEIGWVPEKGIMVGHHFSGFGWYSPADANTGNPDGSGATLSYEWKPQDRDHSIFLRYAWSSSSATLTRQLVTGGFMLKNPFGMQNDFFGVAAGWGDPTERTFDPPDGSGPINVQGGGQGVIEVFHRFQVTPLFQITPDIQLLIKPSFNSDSDVVAVFGLRARFAL